MFQDGVITTSLLSFLPGYTTIGLLVWLLVIMGVIGFLVSLLKR